MVFRTKIFLPLLLLLIAFLWQCQSYNVYQQGELLYLNKCANCHMEDGSGLKGLIPPLAKADYFRDNPAKIVCIIRKGLEGPVVVNGKTYNQKMAAIPELSDIEIANIINYVSHTWENNLGYTKMTTVQAALEKCPLD
jgi:mono/diheme cytochrome c family protein